MILNKKPSKIGRIFPSGVLYSKNVAYYTFSSKIFVSDAVWEPITHCIMKQFSDLYDNWILYSAAANLQTLKKGPPF